MKKVILNSPFQFLLFVVALYFVSCATPQENRVNGNDALRGTINISGAFALYPIVVKWSEEFKKIHPNVRFNVSAGGAGKGISDALGGLVDLGMVSRSLNDSELSKGAFVLAVSKDAVVPVVNAMNPNLNELLRKGISPRVFAQIFVEQRYQSWEEMGYAKDFPLHVYTRSDAAGAAESWAMYFGKKQEDLQGIGVFGDPGLLQAIKKDIRSIGYNNIGFAYNIKTRKANKGVCVVPIDLNDNGQIDADENIYGSLDDVSRAIVAGKFPSPPARDLYLVSKGKPKSAAVLAFLNWVLADGQKFVFASGYVPFSKEKLELELAKLK